MSATVTRTDMSRELPLIRATDMVPRMPGYVNSAALAASSLLPTSKIEAAHTAVTRSPLSSRDEGRRAYRVRSIETIAEAHGDVQGFLQELEDKRRQLDEQIQRYIKQKDREYKFYERDLRVKYRNASQAESSRANDGSPTPVKKATNGTGARTEAAEQTNGVGKRHTVEQSLDTRPVLEEDESGHTESPEHNRDAEVLGLFTPAYLPLLDDTFATASRSPSAPAVLAVANGTKPLDKVTLRRSHSDPVGESGRTSYSARESLEQRTASAGLGPRAHLISALKSTSPRPRLPKQKRVSLVVGDDIVAPSDNVRGGSPVLQRHDENPPSEKTHSTPPSENDPTAAEISDGDVSLVNGPVRIFAVTPPSNHTSSGLTAALASLPPSAHHGVEQDSTHIEQVADSEVASPFAMDEEIGEGPLADTRAEEEEIITRSATPSPDISPSVIEAETAPLIRTPTNTVTPPKTPFQTSPSASSQPVSPGFSRPKVQTDPQFTFDDEATTPEIEHNSTFGSFSQSRSPYMQTSGSLGESFMARHAEELMKKRGSNVTR